MRNQGQRPVDTKADAINFRGKITPYRVRSSIADIAPAIVQRVSYTRANKAGMGFRCCFWDYGVETHRWSRRSIDYSVTSIGRGS